MGTILSNNLEQTRSILIETFINKSNIIHNYKYDYSKAIYVNNKQQIEIICPTHGSFWQTPSRHLNSKGCLKCQKAIRSSLETFIDKANAVHNYKYDYSKAIYNGNDVELEIICPIHGSFWRRPRTHTSIKSGCPTCFKPIKSEQSYYERAKLKFNNRFQYHPSVIKNHINIVCPTHGLISMRYSDHLKSVFGCNQCYDDSRRMSHETYVKSATLKHNYKYDYSKTNLIAMSNEIIIICPNHGEFTQKAGAHLYEGKGCAKCAETTLGLDGFLEKSRSVHGLLYDYSKVVYRSVNHQVEIICRKHGSFFQCPVNHFASAIGCKKCNSSKLQEEIRKIIISLYDGEVLEADRSIITPYELDFFIPEFNFAIEVNGNYWHSYNRSETKTQRYRHHHKATLCANNNISLFQISEHEFDRLDIIKSMINHKLNKSLKIGARKCQLISLTTSEARNFFDRTHINRFNGATIYYGLVYDNKIVSAISFINRHKYWEIMRFSCELGKTVVGGFSKLLKGFIEEHRPNEIITFADRRWSMDAKTYQSNGFKLIRITKPGYVYLDRAAKYLGSRQSFQKHKLDKLLEIFNPNLTESENMFLNGYRRLWDAGHFKLNYKLG